VVYNITQVSFRQLLCPERLLGRMNATIRFAVWGTIPIGSLLGGILGSTIGLRPTLWVAVAGSALAVVPVFFSPLRWMRELPTEYEPPDAAAGAAGAPPAPGPVDAPGGAPVAEPLGPGGAPVAGPVSGPAAGSNGGVTGRSPGAAAGGAAGGAAAGVATEPGNGAP
jgi:hypothetical protein